MTYKGSTSVLLGLIDSYQTGLYMARRRGSAEKGKKPRVLQAATWIKQRERLQRDSEKPRESLLSLWPVSKRRDKGK